MIILYHIFNLFHRAYFAGLGITGVLNGIIYIIIGLGIIAGGWYGWKWWKHRQEPPTVQFPPQNPVVNFSDAQNAMPEATEKSTTGQNPNVQ